MLKLLIYADSLVVVDRMSNGKQNNMSVTIDVRAVKEPTVVDKCIALQNDVFKAIASMTSFTVDSVNVRIRDIARNYDDMYSRKMH